MKRKVSLERTYAYPPARVWQALTDPEALGEWLMKNDFQAKVGHKFQFRAKPQPGWNGIVDCEVMVVDEPRTLAYRWRGNPGENRSKEREINTIVTWSLEPIDAGAGTRLRLEHDGFEGVIGVALSHLLERGWKKMLAERFEPALLRLGDGSRAAADVENDCHTSAD